MLVEGIITAILVLTVASSCDSRRRDTFGLTPLMVGFSVTACHYFAVRSPALTVLVELDLELVRGLSVLLQVRVTGSSMNPARSFGPALFANNWNKHYVRTAAAD